MVLGKRNYQLIAVGVCAIIIGYTLMAVEGEIDGWLSLYVAPLILIFGYLEIIYALLWRPDPEKREAEAAQGA